MKFDSVILAVAHEQFKKFNILSLVNDLHVIYDVKGYLDRNAIDGRL